MSKRIWSHWYRNTGAKYGNFGDELGPYIIRKLSQDSVHHLPFPRSGFLLFLSATRAFIMRRRGIRDYIDCIRFIFSGDDYVLSAGSIIAWGSGPRRIIWGSGIISLQDKIPAAKFLAVRGEETRKLLIEQGHSAPDVVGDPGLLAPMVYTPSLGKKHQLGVVLHYIHADEIDAASLPDGVIVINLLDDIETVIEAICSCERILSTSLHGIIVAHAYRISALWVDVPTLPLTGDNVKFKDYFSSVGIASYTPLHLKEIDMRNVDEVFAGRAKQSDTQVDLDLLRKNLLSVAPFKLAEPYALLEG
tara:strand:- start:5861 stop:6772 length:912 start_codon:yes stop_codon:yes gene_type:complete